jgi:hypothetical protein
MSEEKNIVMVAEDELLMAKIEKYYPGSGLGIMGTIPIDDYIKIHTEILEDWFNKGYMQVSYRLVGPQRRLYYVFSKTPSR